MYTCIFMFFETNRMIVSEEKSFLPRESKKTEDETKRRKCIKKIVDTRKKGHNKKKTRKPRAKMKNLTETNELVLSNN